MPSYTLDEVDKRILAHIQEDARFTATGLAEKIGVSDNTIHHRLDVLEREGVIAGYRTVLDPERLGLPLCFVFVCTVRISQRSDVAARVRDIPGVLTVTELMTGQHNLLVKAVGATDEEITRLATRLDELNLEINDENMVRAEHSLPVDVAGVGETGDG